MYYPSANRVQQFQANFLRKMAADKKQEETPPWLAPGSTLGGALGWKTDPYGSMSRYMDLQLQKQMELEAAQNEIRNLKQLGPTVERSKAYDRYNKAVEALGGGYPSAQDFDLQPFREQKAAEEAAARRERIKQVLLSYAPYVGGGLALGSVLGGLVGSRYNKTLAGGLLGGIAGAGLAGAGKYAYDKYRAKSQQA